MWHPHGCTAECGSLDPLFEEYLNKNLEEATPRDA